MSTTKRDMLVRELRAMLEDPAEKELELMTEKAIADAQSRMDELFSRPSRIGTVSIGGQVVPWEQEKAQYWARRNAGKP